MAGNICWWTFNLIPLLEALLQFGFSRPLQQERH